MAVYAVVQVDVNDAEAYEKYRVLAGPAVQKYGGTFLARGGKTLVKEGGARARIVLISFPDWETAEAFYDGPEYQEALAHGLPASERDYVFVEGV